MKTGIILGIIGSILFMLYSLFFQTPIPESKYIPADPMFESRSL